MVKKDQVFLSALYSVRVLLCLLPQHGYIHPDEFFQFTEPIAGDLTDTKVHLTWEFTSNSPIRNVFFPVMLSAPIFGFFNYWTIRPSPWMVMVMPRLMMTLVSFISDYCLYQICKHGKRHSRMSVLIIYATSYISLTYSTHTFSNTIELILLTILHLFVSKSMASNEAAHRSVIGIILALGFFNRPTFVCFAAPAVIYWAFTSKKGSVKAVVAVFRLFSLLPIFTILSTLLIFNDTIYHRNLFINEFVSAVLEARLDKLLVITPLNFIEYNRKSENLENHGLHSRHQHLLVNVPLAFSLLGFYAYKGISNLGFKILRKKRNIGFFIRPIEGLMLASFLVPLLSLSFIPHQEPRFLIPCLPPLCFLYAGKVHKNAKVFGLWLTINLLFAYFYGFVHQSGVTKALFDFNLIWKKNVYKTQHVIMARTYLPPQHILGIPNDLTTFHFHDLSIDDFPKGVHMKINELKELKIKNDIYLALPSCLTPRLLTLFSNTKVTSFKVLKQYFPHFTFEDLDSSLEIMFKKNHEWSWKEAFSLNLWRFNL